jgi:serine protease Do
MSLFFRPANGCGAEPDIRRDAAVAAIEQAIPSVVNIATETIIERHDWYEQLLRNFYGWQGMVPTQRERSINLGSGVIIDEEGYLLTNAHVINRATRIQVKLWDGREYDADWLVATTDSDVALLKIKAKPGEKFKAIKLAADDDLLLGETVIALGNPYGLGGSVTKGILSSKNRRPPTGNEPLNVQDWLQTDAAINPGNSGGPLVNLRGELIGLNVAVYRDEQHGERGMGVSFSIPVKQVSAAVSLILRPETSASLWFGAQVKAGSGPVVISAVQPDSPASKAGLQAGDEVLEVNGQAPRGPIAFNGLLCAATNHQVKLLVGGKRERSPITVSLVPFHELIRQKLGLTLLEPSPQTAASFGLQGGDGLFIDEIEKNGPADKVKLQRGYIVSAIDDKSTTDIRTVGDVVCGRKKGETVKLSVIVPRRLGGSYVEFRQGAVELEVR